MSDNTRVLNPSAVVGGEGDIIATDDIDGVKYQRVKLIHGSEGLNAGDVAADNPLPVTGPLTDAELRDSAVPVSLGSVPSHPVTNDGTFAVQVSSTPATTLVSTNNSTTAILAAGATFTGTGEDVSTYASVVVAAKTDKSGTLYMEFSPDNINWDSSLSFPVAAGTNEVHRLTVTRKYYRCRFSNTAGTDQGYFRLQSTFGSQPALTSALNSTVQNDADSLVTRSVLMGESDGGVIKFVPVTPEGHLEVAVHGPLNPFGSIHTESLTPVFQTDAIYGINSAEILSTTGMGYETNPPVRATSSGVNDVVSNMFRCSTGTTPYSFATLQSRKRLRYRSGQGVVGRFTAMWPSAVAASTVVAGFGTAEAGYFFGYSGTTFGILHSTGSLRAIVTLTITNATSSGGTVTFRLNGMDYAQTLTTSATTTITANNIASQSFPGWEVEARGATVIFLASSTGARSGTFSISLGTAIGTAGTFATTVAGTTVADTFIPQATWNCDACDGAGSSGFLFDPTKGNVFQIGVAWLGFGPVTFSIMVPSADGNNANWVVVHTINNPNTRTVPHASQPSFPFTMAAYSAGSTTDVSVQVASIGAFTEGVKKLTGPRMTYFNTTGVASTTSSYTPIFSVRNDYVYAARANQSVVNLLSLGGAAISNTGLTSFYLIRNGTLTGQSWASYAPTSCTYVDVAATAVTFAVTSQVIWTGTVSKDGEFTFPLTDEVTLQPGETITMAVRSVTATATACVGQLNTREDQ